MKKTIFITFFLFLIVLTPIALAFSGSNSNYKTTANIGLGLAKDQSVNYETKAVMINQPIGVFQNKLYLGPYYLFNYLGITCFKDLDCGNDSYIGPAFCDTNDDVSRDYLSFTCNDSGTIISYCSNTTTQEVVDDCNSDEFCEDANCHPRIDLSIDRVDVSRVNPPTAGSLTLIRFILDNNEPNEVNNVEYTIDTGSSDTNPSYNIPNIEAATQMKVWSSWIYQNSGIYTAKIILDPDNNIRETDETNNEKTFTVDVS